MSATQENKTKENTSWMKIKFADPAAGGERGRGAAPRLVSRREATGRGAVAALRLSENEARV